VKPTRLQKKTFDAIIENEASANPLPMGKVLKSVGHPPSVQIRPRAVTEQRGFQVLMEKSGITDDYLSQKLKEGLEADRLYGKDNVPHPDYSTRHKYLETGLKLKGIQETQAPAGTVFNTQINQTNLDPNSKEAKAIIDNTLDILMKQTIAE